MRNALKIVIPLLHFALCIFLIIFLSACGEEAIHSSSETGSIAFSVQFQGAANESSGLSQAIDCGSSGVSTVEAQIYDESDSLLASGGPWNCGAHSGAITSVPAGSNRKIVIIGKGSSGNILYWGEKTGITVTAGVTNNAGVITAASFLPTNVGASAGDSQVTISWDNVSGATSYNIYWATSSGVTKSTGTNITNVSSPYTHTGRTNGTTYYYVVTAENSYGESGESSEVNARPDTPPSAPTNVGASAGDSQVTISWDNVSGATSYNIYWATSSGVTKSTGTNITNVSSPYTHTGRTNGTTYYYVVTAENSYGESGESSEVNAMPDTPPSAPTNVGASAGDSQVTISWDNVSGATSYNIYWATSSGVTKSTGTNITNVSSPYTHTGRTNGTTYYYVVTAENSYGESGESSEVNAMPLSWTMMKLPDTGQSQSYTDTFGEDSDYTINPPSYTDNVDGTVTDNVTGLMWQQQDDDTQRTWDEAHNYCNELILADYSDWRLPSAMELMSIVDYGTFDPTIDTTYFFGTNSWIYWSSNTHLGDSSRADVVHFGNGWVLNTSKSDGGYVRCTRGGQ